LNSRCRGTKRDGEPCSLSANGPDGYCWAHSPQHAEERRRSASKAGKSKPTAEVHNLKTEIKTVISDVRSGNLDRNDAAVMIQGYRALKDYISVELKVTEQRELIERLEAVEMLLEQRKEARRRYG
jgi:hypothetical protein